MKLALDGDLIRYDSKRARKTELATRKLAGKLGMSDSEIRRQLEKGDSFSLRRRRCTRKFINLPKRKRVNHYPAKCCWHSTGKPENHPQPDYGPVCEARRRTAGALYETVIKQECHAR